MFCKITPLWEAKRSGDLQRVKSMLQEISSENYNEAAQHRHLIETALWSIANAAETGDLAQVQKRVEMWAEFKVRDDLRSSHHLHNALELAIARGYLDVIRYLFKHGTSFTNQQLWCLDRARMSCDDETYVLIMEELVAHGWDVTKDSRIHCAVTFQNTAFLEFVLRHGANPNENNRMYSHNYIYSVKTPLSTAAREGSMEQLNLLLSYGAFPESRCLHFILRRSRLDRERLRMLSLLLDFGADIDGLESPRLASRRRQNVAPTAQHSVLTEALKAGDDEAAKLLIERGADLTKRGWVQPLQEQASRAGDLLSEPGARIKGPAPVEYMVQSRNEEIRRLVPLDLAEETKQYLWEKRELRRKQKLEEEEQKLREVGIVQGRKRMMDRRERLQGPWAKRLRC